MTIDFGTWALKNRNLLHFVIAVLLLGGLWAAYMMSKLEDPEIQVKMAVVVSTYPGASAHEVELQVVDPLEKELKSIGVVANVLSTIYSDFAITEVQLRSSTDADFVEQSWDLLRRKVGDMQSSLPSGASMSVQDDFGLVYGMLYAFTGDGLTERQMQDYASMVQRELTNLPAVAKVSLYGLREECINVNILPDKMSTLGVSPAEVLSTLNGQNSAYYAGYFNSGDDKRIRVMVEDRFTAIKEISDMIIQGHEDDQLRLSDIATVENGFSEPVRNSMTYNGQHAFGIAVAGTSGSDIVKVGIEVENKLKELKATRLPLGADFNKVFYQPSQVSSSLSTFLLNLLESILIVVACLMVTMGFRSGLIIGASLFITVIGSFLLLYQADGTMQRVSLGAFILAMGMLVDNAIVIVDGVLIDLKRGINKSEALVRIGKKTAMPLLGATMIASIAFLPVFLSPDTAGIYIRDLFIVLTVSLMLSWFLALTHVPVMCNKLLKVSPEKTGDSENIYSGKIYDSFRSILTFALRHMIFSVIFIVALIALSIYGYGLMKNAFFPDMVYSQCYMEYKLPEGTSNLRVRHDLEEIQQYLHSRKEITNITASYGGTPARYNLVRSIATPSLSYGELIIDFTSPNSLDNNIDEIQKVLEERYPDAYLKMKKYNIMYKKYPIEVMFVGPDPAVLHNLSSQALEIMKKDPKITLAKSLWDKKIPLFSVDYKQSEARRAGVSRRDLSISLMSAAGGIPIGTFYEGVHRNTIYLKCAEEGGKQLSNLENTPIFSTIPNFYGVLNSDLLLRVLSGKAEKSELISSLLGTSPLKQVSDGINIKWEDPVVTHYNNQRSESVVCSPISSVQTEQARAAIAKKIESIELPAGYSMSWEGEKGASDETLKSLFSQVPVGVIMIIGLLIMLFGDYKKPIIILLGIPMLAIGVVGAMLLTGIAFTFCSIVGALGLVGMMIKNGIVLLDEIDDRMKSTDNPQSALIESAVSRLRPVTMASLTTILGMIPLLSDAMFASMAATIMGGLTFSTIATLLFVPIFYSMFFKIRISKS